MRFFASWWERTPRQKLGTAIVLIALMGFLGAYFGASDDGSRLFRPTGEVWG